MPNISRAFKRNFCVRFLQSYQRFFGRYYLKKWLCKFVENKFFIECFSIFNTENFFEKNQIFGNILLNKINVIISNRFANFFSKFNYFIRF